MFWISVGLLLYTYGGYPFVLVVLGSLKQLKSDLAFGLARRTRRASRNEADRPRVSIVFAAHNEAAVIAQKMLNCANLDYPAESLEILIGCDGCTDATAALARAAAAAERLGLRVSRTMRQARGAQQAVAAGAGRDRRVLRREHRVRARRHSCPRAAFQAAGDRLCLRRAAVAIAQWGQAANSSTGDLKRCSSFSRAA